MEGSSPNAHSDSRQHLESCTYFYVRTLGGNRAYDRFTRPPCVLEIAYGNKHLFHPKVSKSVSLVPSWNGGKASIQSKSLPLQIHKIMINQSNQHQPVGALHRKKFNSKKCTFRVKFENFLGCMIDQRGIEANPNKIKVVLNMKSPTIVKEVQMLTSCIVMLRRFMLRSVDKCLPFFKVLKKTCFGWDEEAEQASQSLKEYLGRSPQMVSLLQGNCCWHILPSPTIR